MNIFKAIFNGWIRPRMEYQAAQVVETAEIIAGVKKDAEETPPEETPREDA